MMAAEAKRRDSEIASKRRANARLAEMDDSARDAEMNERRRDAQIRAAVRARYGIAADALDADIDGDGIPDVDLPEAASRTDAYPTTTARMGAGALSGEGMYVRTVPR